MQNASLTLMYRRAPAHGLATASAMWNAAYDIGLGLGGTGFGLLAGPVSYPAGFGLTAALVLAALGPASRDRAAARGRTMDS
ncbi:MAG TPA: hypothetical protein VMI33_19945 [Streptosporangiaceae bacterium]|nr:hypothetical protein [Streptosporangiaceae bacterium]